MQKEEETVVEETVLEEIISVKEEEIKNEGDYLKIVNDLKKQYDEITQDYDNKIYDKDNIIKHLREIYDKDINVKNKRILYLNQRIKTLQSEKSFYKNCYEEIKKFMSKLFLFFNKSLPDTHSITMTCNTENRNFIDLSVDLDDETSGIHVRIDDFSSFFNDIPKLRTWFESII